MRYGTFVSKYKIQRSKISYNLLTPKPDPNRENSLRPEPIRASLSDAYALLAPYVGVRIKEQLKAVVPLALYLGLFQVFVLDYPIQEATALCLGLVAVIIGLAIFMEGLSSGLMPFGNIIGTNLPAKASMPVVLLILGILGVGVTFAEPAIGALQAFGSSIDVIKAPYLFELLNNWTLPLVLMVGAGVGIAAILGTVRFIYGWSLKPLIYISVIPLGFLSAFFWFNPDLRSILGLAWDCGAVTTGPVTVPLVLAIGIGIANSAGKGNSSLSGFGVVTLASLFPIMAVLLLTLFVYSVITPDQIIANAAAIKDSVNSEVSVWEQTPLVEIILGVRAIVPLVLFLGFVLFVVLRSKLTNTLVTVYGLSLCVIGMCIFNIGLTYGLGAMGTQTGQGLPGAFIETNLVESSPIFSHLVGIIVVILFAFVLGFGATLAEPALNALGLTVQKLTNGAFKKEMLMYSVAIGVAVGISLGVAKLVLDLDLATLLLPLYLAGLILTALSSEEFVNVAWDSAGVTTGPVTVPLVLAMGLGLGKAVSATEGFGILSLASICPIIAVLTMGLLIKIQQKRQSAA
ncbi:MAG: hypothetical protein CMF71_06855 [Magnetovibrio sp.]|nr:hypothetical protein [Magnetovibrio sp.]|tara:strand:+ start:4950 stop:6665 length:1716 start_codon:yes stop_codon:yes gene_type:complete